jgi:aldehyde:ferredoxin oxidoreductase
MDALSAGVVVGFVMDCHENGILSHEDLGGIDAHFGNADAMLQLLEKMGKREGIGETLSNGVRMAADKIGKGAEKLAQHIKGLEVTGYDLRCLKTAALGFAVSFRGADHNRTGAYAVDINGKVDRLKAEKGRGKLVGDMEDIYALIDSLIVCKFARGTFYKEIPEMAELYNLVTGIDETPKEMKQAGERINTLGRLINVREGLDRKDDTLPWKVMNTPVPDEGPVKGAFVSQEELDLLLDDYYEARGWTLKGIPKTETLKELEMDDLAGIVAKKQEA